MEPAAVGAVGRWVAPAPRGLCPTLDARVPRKLPDPMPGNDVLQSPLVETPRERDCEAWLAAAPLDAGHAPARLTQRPAPPRDRRRMGWLLALVLVGHALVFGWLLWAAPARPPPPGHVLKVTFFDATPLPPAPPAPAWPTLPQAAPPVVLRHRVPRAPGSLSVTLGNPPRLNLYGPNGQVRLPPPGSASTPPAYRAVPPTGDGVLTIKTPLHYKPTRFNDAWAPVDQTKGGKLLDRLVDKTSVKKTVKLPTGDRVTCAVNPLLALAGGLFGCHGHIPPPPKNDHDVRLSMPPAESLTGKKVPLPAAATTAPPPAGSP